MKTGNGNNPTARPTALGGHDLYSPRKRDGNFLVHRLAQLYAAGSHLAHRPRRAPGQRDPAAATFAENRIVPESCGHWKSGQTIEVRNPIGRAALATCARTAVGLSSPGREAPCRSGPWPKPSISGPLSGDFPPEWANLPVAESGPRSGPARGGMTIREGWGVTRRAHHESRIAGHASDMARLPSGAGRRAGPVRGGGRSARSRGIAPSKWRRSRPPKPLPCGQIAEYEGRRDSFRSASRRQP